MKLRRLRVAQTVMFPSPDILNNFAEGKYVLSNLAAKRAKQLREGAPPLVQVDSQHPLTIALAEIAAGKIKPIMPTVQEIEIHEVRELNILSDELLPAELGIPLPGLDELEIGKIPVGILAEDDHDHDDGDIDGEHEDGHEDAAPVTLSDFVGDDDDDDVHPANSDEDTLSLSDLAEQETNESEDEEEHGV